MPKIVKDDEPFERVEMPRERSARALPRPEASVQGRAPRNRPGRRDGPVVLPPGRVHRPLPRPARSQRRRDRRVQAALGGRRLLEGRRLAPAVAAALRHRLLHQAGARRPSASRSKRPSAATTACWASSSNCSPIEPTVGSGLVLWLPKGAIIRHELENFLYGELPHAATSRSTRRTSATCELYETSGHFPYYNDSQFPPIEMADGERYLLKPMNCPHHITIYQSKPRSYRDLPLRLAEFGTVLPLRAVGRAERHDPRPRLHPGRRPHLLHRGAGGRRVPRLHRDDPDSC